MTLTDFGHIQVSESFLILCLTCSLNIYSFHRLGNEGTCEPIQTYTMLFSNMAADMFGKSGHYLLSLIIWLINLNNRTVHTNAPHIHSYWVDNSNSRVGSKNAMCDVSWNPPITSIRCLVFVNSSVLSPHLRTTPACAVQARRLGLRLQGAEHPPFAHRGPESPLST